MIADKIDFQNYDAWSREHDYFLMFLLGTGSFLASRVDDHYLVSYQEDRMFKKASIFSGMNFVCSRADYKSVTDDEILGNISWIFEMSFISIFIATYWSHHQRSRSIPLAC
jgi:hypothetical protein